MKSRILAHRFDQVASMRVEGLRISAIARIMSRFRSTISRWLERAAAAAKRFNDQKLSKFEIKELQADELSQRIPRRSTPLSLNA